MRNDSVVIGAVVEDQVGNASTPRNIGAIMAETLADNPMELEHQIIAQPVQDDYAGVETRIAQTVNERLRHRKLESPTSKIVVAAEEVNDSSTFCGLQRRALWMLVALPILVVGVVVVALLYSHNGKDDAVPSTTSDHTTLVDHALLEELRSLNAVSDEELSLFSEPTSAQFRALSWLKSDTIVMSQGRSTRDLVQRYVLAVLYFATSRADWTWSYLSSKDVCTWNNGTEHPHGVYCELDGVSINELIFDHNNLQGPMPWELVLLTNLEILSLSFNGLTGSIPMRINELTRLRTFHASSNELTGTLPSTFSPETNQIILNENGIVGTIPQLWGTSMPGLEMIGLYSNELTGPIPTILVQLSKLWSIDFAWNRFTGSIPSELGQMLSLSYLNIHDNFLGATIPTELGQLIPLDFFASGSNQLSGTLPSEIGQLLSLTHFDIVYNKLTGTIPSELGQLLSMNYLDIGRNQLTGAVPSEIGQLLSLSSISIMENQLTSSIPSEIGHLLSLRYFDFASNVLTGSVDELFCTGNRTWDLLAADCDEVACECCTKCCYSTQPECENIFK